MLERIGSVYYLRRRVPTRYHGVVDRRAIRLSLHTDSERIARTKAERVWSDLIESWEARLAGDTADAEAYLAAAKNLADARGYRFLMAKDVATLPAADLLKHVTEVAETSQPGKPDLMAADALLGAAPAPAIRISDLASQFFDVAGDRNLGKSAD